MASGDELTCVTFAEASALRRNRQRGPLVLSVPSRAPTNRLPRQCAALLPVKNAMPLGPMDDV
jgi:hypothetical protein